MEKNREIRRMYECGQCQEVHAFESDAEDCCKPDVNEVYVCPVCEEVHDLKKDAEACLAGHVEIPECDAEHCPNCLREADTAQLRVEIAVAGHCSQCNPIYTPEQNLTILDALHPRH
jgi:hypothetical protein